METETFRIRLSGEDLKKFNSIKKSIGISSNPTVFKLLISKYNSAGQSVVDFVPIATKKGVVNVPRDVYNKIVSMKNEDLEAAEILAFQVLGVQPHEYPPVGANNWGNIILNFFK